MTQPFIHKFQTQKNKYIFDANTLNILRVDDVVWDIIDDHGKISCEAMLTKYKDRYSEEEINKACSIINESQRNYLCSSQRPKVRYLATRDDIEKKLSKNRKILMLNISDDCNLACEYCVYGNHYKNRRKRRKSSMDWFTAKAAIDHYLSSCCQVKSPTITFYGGEALLEWELMERCIKYAREKGGDRLGFGVTTNGLLLHGSISEMLAREGVMINVSIDGPQSVHDRYRKYANGGPSWNIIIKNLREFIRKYPEHAESKLSFGAVLAGPLDIEQVREFFIECDIIPEKAHVNFSYLNKNGLFKSFGQIAGLKDSRERFINLLSNGQINENPGNKEWRMERRLFEKPWLILYKRMLNPWKSYNNGMMSQMLCFITACYPGEQKTYVDVEGNYWPCERMPYEDKFKIGHVSRGFDVEKIEELLRGWVEMIGEDCEKCWCVGHCHIGCWANVWGSGSDNKEQKKKACGEYKSMLNGLLIDYCGVMEQNQHALDYMENIELL